MSAVIEVRDVSFRYPAGAGRRARPFGLAHVSVAMSAGEILGVIGPNSAGKTTLIRLLTRVLQPERGEILFEGRPLGRLTRWEAARHVAVVPQEAPAALPFTVRELVLMGRYAHAPRRFFETPRDLEATERAMKLTGLTGLADAPLASLAGGERQRAMLARALAQEPRVLILDEPTAHLDLRHQAECVALLRRLTRSHGLGVLLVTHDLDLAAQVGDRLLLLAAGSVAALGAPAEVLREPLIAAVYGCRVRVEVDAETGRAGVRVLYAASGEEVRSKVAD